MRALSKAQTVFSSVKQRSQLPAHHAHPFESVLRPRRELSRAQVASERSISTAHCASPVVFQEVWSIRLTYDGVSVSSPQPPTSRMIPTGTPGLLKVLTQGSVAGPGAGVGR